MPGIKDDVVEKKKPIVPLYASQAQAVAVQQQKAGERDPVIPVTQKAMADYRAGERDPVVPTKPNNNFDVNFSAVTAGSQGHPNPGAVPRGGQMGSEPKEFPAYDPQMQPGGYGFAAKYDNLYDPQNRPGGYGYAASLANPPGPSLRVGPVVDLGGGGGLSIPSGSGGVPSYNGGYPDGGGWGGGYGGYYGGGGGYADDPRGWHEGLMNWRF